MKIFATIAILLTLTGCAALDTTAAVLDVIFPTDPAPVCDRDSVGVTVDGLGQCVKFDDESFRWK